jgi:solute carrier family 25 S-adenosylmethionine transporter 26
LLQAGGGRALYAGVWGNLVGVAPASAIFMAVYEPVKQVWGSWLRWSER